jgi:hypothetical protein
VAGEANHRGFVEQIAVVFQRRREPAVQLLNEERAVEHRCARLGVEGRELQIGELLRVLLGILQGEHHLEDRRMARVALRSQRLDQKLEGYFLLRIGSEAHGPYAREELAYGGAPGKLDPQRQRVDEETDQRLEVPARTIGERRSDDQIFLTGVARQHDSEGGEQHHEERRAGLPGQLRERPLELGSQQEAVGSSAKRLQRWPGAVER